MIVLDASAAVTRVLPSQATPASISFFTSSLTQAYEAPAVFQLEVVNGLLRAERRGLVSAAHLDAGWRQIEQLVTLRGWQDFDLARVKAVSRQQALSLFDACYIDLALREGAALASRDTALLEAARRLGVATHDLR